jgi:hypothetical protein
MEGQTTQILVGTFSRLAPFSAAPVGSKNVTSLCLYTRPLSICTDRRDAIKHINLPRALIYSRLLLVSYERHNRILIGRLLYF